MGKRYVVELSAVERQQLEEILRRGRSSRFRQTRARLFLKADEGAGGPGWTDAKICEAFDLSPSTVLRARKQLVEEGLEAALERKSSPRPDQRVLDGAQEARLIALACGPPPEGRAQWTLRLLADRMVVLDHDLDHLSHETVRKTLKKNELKPHLRQCWCIPPEANAEFVYRMEEVLEVYQLPYDPRFPVVCMDETSKQLVAEVAAPIQPAPGRVLRHDYEYRRNGVANLFLAFEPLRGWRWVEITERRTRKDWAHFIAQLLERHYPEAECLLLVLDNLNTHSGASFYEAFAPDQARELLGRLHFVHTPKHGSWLNLAEAEFSILQRQCLDRRIPEIPVLARETHAWVQQRNQLQVGADWQFTTQDARIKLKRLYPSFEG